MIKVTKISAALLLASTALTAPALAQSQGDAQWTVSIEGGFSFGYTSGRADESAVACTMSCSSTTNIFAEPADELVSFSADELLGFVGRFAAARRVGDRDHTFAFGGGSFTTDTVVHGEQLLNDNSSNEVATPFGNCDTSEMNCSTRNDVHFINGDWEYGAHLPMDQLTDNSELRVFGGTRFEYLGWERKGGVISTGLIPNPEKSSFVGAGPRLGGEFTVPIQGGMTLSASGSGGVLFGILSNDLVRNDEREFSYMPFVESEVAVGFNIGPTLFEVGYGMDFRMHGIQAAGICFDTSVEAPRPGGEGSDLHGCLSTEKENFISHGAFARINIPLGG